MYYYFQLCGICIFTKHTPYFIIQSLMKHEALQNGGWPQEIKLIHPSSYLTKLLTTILHHYFFFSMGFLISFVFTLQ